MAFPAVRRYRAQIRAQLEAAFAEEHTPHEVGCSFAVGVFLTALPTFGVGLLVFVVLVWLFEWVSRLALLAAVVVLNPVVKPAVYLASVWLGARLLAGRAPEDPTAVEVGRDVLTWLLVGNLVLATVLAVVGYVVVYRLTVAYRTRELDLVERVIEG